MKARIDIDTRTFVRFWLVVIGFALVAVAIYSARSALIVIGVALFLALALNTPVSRITRRLPGKSRVGATAIAYVAVLIVLGAVIFLVIPPIVQQTAKFVQTIPSVIDNVTKQSHSVSGLINKYNLQPQVDQAMTSLKDGATGWAGDIGKNVITGIGSVLGFITDAILVLVLTFLMLVEGPAWIKKYWHVYSDDKRMLKHKEVAGRMYAVFTGYVTGQLTVSAIDGLGAGLVVFVLSLFFPSIPLGLAMTTAAVTFVLSLIPLFGATIAGLVITVLIAFNSIPAAIIYIAFFVIYQQVENNFISPRIQSKKIDLSALAVLIAVTIGLYVFGLAGGIIAIPIAGIVRILVEEYIDYRKQAHLHDTEKA